MYEAEILFWRATRQIIDLVPSIHLYTPKHISEEVMRGKGSVAVNNFNASIFHIQYVQEVVTHFI